MKFYIGTYIDVDDKKEKTVYKCTVNKKKEVSVELSINAGKNPSFLCESNDRNYIYIVNELCMGVHGSYGKIVCLQKKHDGLYKHHSILSTEGDYPCHVLLDSVNDLLYVTNYGSGSLAVYSLGDDGLILSRVQIFTFEGKSVHPTRQEAAHFHQSLLSPCGKHVFVTDLGSDCIHIFSIEKNKCTPLSLIKSIPVTVGTGPRHMVFDNEYKHMYVSGELSSSVVVFEYDSKNASLTYKQNCPAFVGEVESYPRTSAAEIAYYKNKVYMSNRGDDSITVFQMQRDGRLQRRKNISCAGKMPRNFKIFSHAPWGGEATIVVGNQDSHNLAFFKIEDDNLIHIRNYNDVTSPVCIC